MDWKDIAGSLVRAGAPIIGTAILGPLGGTLGNVLGNIVASQLGVDPTPEAVASAVAGKNPDEVRDALAKAESEAAAKWDALARMAEAEAAVATKQVEAVNASIVAETQAKVGGGDGWLGKWRGIMAWELTIESPFWAAMIMYSVIYGGGTAVNELSNASGIIITYWGARFGVLGIHVYQGSNERQAALAGAQVPSAATRVTDGLRNIISRRT